ncbi:MAG: 50S ribosomal protein L37ae [Candidatus Woesearchaeota archaeon]
MVKEVPKSIKRFGPRYGRRNKLMFGQIEEKQRSLHKCPYCKKQSVKRKSAGIWFCKKCNSKFTGKAYSLE